MARAKRTTKTVAQRIDLHYFKRPHPFRRRLFMLSLLLPVLAMIWLASYALTRNNHIYSSGRMAPAHAVLTQKCGTCHVSRAGFFTAKSNDQACLTCHDAPLHHANQVFAPQCSSCHVEHRGLARLSATADESCAQCHASLRTTGGTTSYARNISSFGPGHSEFAALRPGFTNPATIKLNHAVHVKGKLLGPHGLVQLVCEDCHSANATSQVWRFPIAPDSPPGETPKAIGVSAVSIPGEKLGPPSRAAVRAYMGPIVYANHCAGCHPMPFDERFTESVPHDTPERVHAFLVKKFQDYIAAHPRELSEVVSTVGLPAKPVPVSPRMYRPREWVEAKAAEAELLLWGKTCKQCHSLGFPPAGGTNAAQPAALPVVAKSNIMPRWFQHAMFDHDQHRLVGCESCHTRARTSQESSDVLLPSIQTCQQCHHSGDDGAESRCFECHIYHDWKNEKEKTQLSLTDLLNRRPVPNTATAPSSPGK